MEYERDSFLMITKEELDKLAHKYENPDFIKEDPIQFLHYFSKSYLYKIIVRLK